MNTSRYDHRKVEKRWQEAWAKEKAFSAPAAPNPKTKRYVLDMFPYPSGDGLHVGHTEGYTATDIVSRYLRMKGHDVLHPMGWDAFGLPAENAAIKKKIHPQAVTEKNIATFKGQIQRLGFSYDWDREFSTTDPEYYRWTQWIFLQLYKRGLAYEAEAPIWWCPKDKTGLANEEVVNGKCDRCGTPVERKMLKQWMLKITAYADRLLSGLVDLDWPESIKAAQRNWIGKSEGAEITFSLLTVGRVLVATNNRSKVARMRKLMAAIPNAPEIVTPTDVGLTVMDVQEGSDVRANAEAKARAYVGKTDLPILGTDTALFIDGENHDPALVRRNALGDRDESSMTQSEKAAMMIDHYRSIAEKHGGQAAGYWLDIFTLIMPDGTSRTSEGRRDVIFTTKLRQPVDEFFPMRSLYINKSTGKYSVDQSEDEEINVDLAPYKKALAELFSPTVPVFTTRPDTIFGATYLVLAPEHDLVDVITTDDQRQAVEKYKKSVAAKSDLERTSLEKEKTGVFTGAYAVNPATKKKIPIWIADYVLKSYGTGAIMAVPAHDERDFAFAQKYQLPVIKVIKPPAVMPSMMPASAGVLGLQHDDITSECWAGEGMLVNSGDFDGKSSEDARKLVTAWLENQRAGRSAVKYKLRDWVFSRQRYWGEPIPLVHCEQCAKDVMKKAHVLNFYFEPVWERLLNSEKTVETRALNPDEPEKYFGNIKDGAYLKCVNKNSGETAFFQVKKTWKFKNLEELLKHPDVIMKMKKRDSLPTLAELKKGYAYTPDYVDRIQKHGLVAWEVERVILGVVPVPEKELPILLPDVKKYEPTGTGESPLAGVKNWVNTTCPQCGGPAKRETNTMPQWAGSCWYYLRYLDPQNKKALASPEKMKSWLPVDTYVGGAEHAVLHLLYARFWHKVLFDAGVIPKECGDEPFRKLKNVGLILGEDHEKMSKSRGNVVNPDDMVEKFGADSLRLFEMFMGPFEDAKPWKTDGMIGVRRFLEKVWHAFELARNAKPTREQTTPMKKYIPSISKGIEEFRFNTCVSDLMKWANEWKDVGYTETFIPRNEFEAFLKVLSPFAPHIAEELWHMLGNTNLLTSDRWPEYRLNKYIEETVNYIVQVNGAKRAIIELNRGLNQADVEKAAKVEENVAKYLTGKPKKTIFVQDRLVNFVV